MKTIKSAHIAGKSWKREMFRFLRQYRANAAHITAFMPHRREPSTKLPKVQLKNMQESQKKLKQSNEQSKAKMKIFADMYATKSDFNQDHI
jgi:hypothetical protein